MFTKKIQFAQRKKYKNKRNSVWKGLKVFIFNWQKQINV